jgi:hypothetical protein
MTNSELLALGMPIVAAAAVGLTALFVRRPWSEPAVEAEVRDGFNARTYGHPVDLDERVPHAGLGIDPSRELAEAESAMDRLKRTGRFYADRESADEAVERHLDLRLDPTRELTEAEAEKIDRLKRTGMAFLKSDESGMKVAEELRSGARGQVTPPATPDDDAIAAPFTQRSLAAREAISAAMELLNQAQRELPLQPKPQRAR